MDDKVVYRLLAAALVLGVIGLLAAIAGMWYQLLTQTGGCAC